MEYKISENIVTIPTEKKPYNKGSEGKVYKIDNEIYKIYYNNMINEGYGSKEKHHIRLLNIPTKQIILPTDVIYTVTDTYAGYKTKFIDGNQKQKTGITQMPSKKFIRNLQVLERDFNLLTENYILAADVSPVNYIYDEKNQTMNVIDPGRYKSNWFNLKSSCQKQNDIQLKYLINLLLYLDFIEYKPVGTKRKAALLRDRIKTQVKDVSYSEFFSKELENFETIHQYAKSLERYIK